MSLYIHVGPTKYLLKKRFRPESPNLDKLQEELRMSNALKTIISIKLCQADEISVVKSTLLEIKFLAYKNYSQSTK